jgi:tight adherence protein C
LRAAATLEDGVPLTADLLAVALAAGLTPYLALRVAARSAPGAVAAHLAAVLAAVEDGARLADALAAHAEAAPVLRPLLEVLLVSERLGAPAGPALARLAADGRARARRAALERARTLPVRLLFPLVFLVLPAFFLLTVGPVLLAGLNP